MVLSMAGQGLVIVEAMGCGCAVVASDLPAIRDVITPDENAILCEAGNPEALATAIESLLSDEAQRLRLAQAGRQSVLDTFDWEVAARRYRELFAELLRR